MNDQSSQSQNEINFRQRLFLQLIWHFLCKITTIYNWHNKHLDVLACYSLVATSQYLDIICMQTWMLFLISLKFHIRFKVQPIDKLTCYLYHHLVASHTFLCLALPLSKAWLPYFSQLCSSATDSVLYVSQDCVPYGLPTCLALLYPFSTSNRTYELLKSRKKAIFTLFGYPMTYMYMLCTFTYTHMDHDRVTLARCLQKCKHSNGICNIETVDVLLWTLHQLVKHFRLMLFASK